MKISNDRIKQLQAILKDQLGLDYSDEQTQDAGLAIMRFIVAKSYQINFKETEKINE